ncbi:MAG: polyphosphate kinase 2 family protein [Myxococcales bacterium]|nr:polyphosphate kinase 2 family protein [Myxococcales bacterium]
MQKEIQEKCGNILKSLRITNGDKFHLKDIAPGDTAGLDDKAEARALTARAGEWLAAEGEKLYAQDRWSVLIMFQAMDAAGKDGTVKHVLSGMNPQATHVTSFKAPSAEELDHDFLWRCSKSLPERGRIGVFNRSWYEEVLVVRIHEALLQKQKLPKSLISKDIWKERLEDIAAYERYLARNGTVILKFFLHVSKDEQKKRFMERLDEPEKNWKFAPSDIAERAHFDEYMGAYEHAIRATAAPWAPWYVIPADKKWFTRLAVSAAIVKALDDLNLAYPEVAPEQREAFAKARASLEAE